MGPSPTLLTLLLNPSLTSCSRFRMGLDLTFPWEGRGAHRESPGSKFSWIQLSGARACVG